MTAWRPISEYPIEPRSGGAYGPLVLARNVEKRPMLVTMVKGEFFLCPGVPIFYGTNQCGFMTASDLIEFMEIPQ